MGSIIWDMSSDDRGLRSMKKRILIIVSAICVLGLGIIVWYNSPIDFVDLNPEDVLEIVIFAPGYFIRSSSTIALTAASSPLFALCE